VSGRKCFAQGHVHKRDEKQHSPSLRHLLHDLIPVTLRMPVAKILFIGSCAPSAFQIKNVAFGDLKSSSTKWIIPADN
jgi:hypothetical protein